MSEHTEGPWTYRNGSRIYLDGIEVAQISFTAGHLKESREQARFIAAACNCHDELVETLKWLNVEFECRDDDFGGVLFTRNDFDRVRKAIAKAEGKVGLTLREGYSGGILPNVWHGLTVCNQEEADEKIPEFLKVPGKKFLIIEPMLGAVDLWAINDGSWWDSEGATRYNALTGTAWWGSTGEHGLGGGPKIDAVILGGETGPGARPVHPDWVRSVRDQCEASNVPFYFKQ